MNRNSGVSTRLKVPIAALLLASAVAVPGFSQQSSSTTPQDAPPAAPATAGSTGTSTAQPDAREGFWGRVNPWARKKWVKKRTDPINDRLTELDAVNAKNF
jgi:hypothetical protein